MSAIDLGIIGAYLIGILVFGHSRKTAEPGSAVDYMLGGRRLTLPAFVATLVATWYGGILGVGEYTFRYGISNWLVFGVPYYLAAFLFAMLLAAKARRTQFITIPDRLHQCYGRHVSGVGAVVLFFWALPTAYILILGVLGNAFFGWPKFVGIVAGTVLVLIYAYVGGFRSLARADIWHFMSMYIGFVITLIALVSQVRWLLIYQDPCASDTSDLGRWQLPSGSSLSGMSSRWRHWLTLHSSRTAMPPRMNPWRVAAFWFRYFAGASSIS